MNKRVALALAAGVVAGATVVGVPTFAYATSDSSENTNGSDMSTVMNDPAFVENAKKFMSEMMSDPQLKEQMQSIMGGMSDMDMSNMGGTTGSGG